MLLSIPTLDNGFTATAIVHWTLPLTPWWCCMCACVTFKNTYIQYLLAFAYCDRIKGLVGCKCKESSEFNSSDTWSNSNLLAQVKVSPWPQPWKTNIRSPCSSMSAHRPSRFHLSDRNKTFFGERSPWRMDGPWMWDCEMQKNTGSRS